ncbi:MAG: hypothetical protein VKL42_08420 [Snowella sp.]|nr:hypothetical protein [Snowella sp.]
MSNLSQVQKIVEFLKSHQGEKFNARQIAEAIVSHYPEDYVEKRNNDRFANEKAFISQIVAEIGSNKDSIIKKDPHICWQDKPRPRIYWYDPKQINYSADTNLEDENISDNGDNDTEYELPVQSIPIAKILSERDLYPLLVDFLKTEYKLYCQRIDEKRSKNQRGSGGNQWLHPDIVAMQAIDKEWHELVKTCVQAGEGRRVRLWSFEVKKELNSSNIRSSFFQAVSNSSWANEGYLVTTSITDNIEQELRMLSALHGIGVILLNTENPSESEIFLPAKSRPEIDWQSVNRIVVENDDFKDYIELVSTYYQTGRIRNRDWNKI